MLTQEQINKIRQDNLGEYGDVNRLLADREQLQKQVDELTAENVKLHYGKFDGVNYSYNGYINGVLRYNDNLKAENKQLQSKLEYIYKWLADKVQGGVPCASGMTDGYDISDTLCDDDCEDVEKWTCWQRFFELMAQESAV